MAALKELIEVREGIRGNELDANVTWRELVNSGIANIIYNGQSTSGSGGLPYGPTSNQDEVDLTPPPQPQNLQATAAVSNIILSWNDPNSPLVAVTEVWRSTTNVAPNVSGSAAVLIGTTEAFLYADNVGPGSGTRYYWVRFRSGSDVVGPYSSGANAQTQASAEYLLQTLTGQITESQLYSTLGSRINLIDAPSSVSGSVNAKVLDLQNQINDIANIPPYSATVTYQLDDQVTYNGSLYRAKGTTTGNLPSNTTYWTLIGNYTSLGAVVADHTTQIGSLTTGLATEVTDRTTLATQLRGGYTGTDLSQLTTGLLYSERQARSSGDAASASRLDILESSVNSGTTGLAATRALLINDYATTASLTSATGSLQTTLTASYQAADNVVLSNAQNYVSSYAYAKASTYTQSEADIAISNQVSTVSARLNSGGDISTAINNVSNTASAKSANFVQGTAPTATKTDDLWIDTANGNILKRWNGTAWVTADDTRIGATATSVQTLQSSVDATTSYRIDAWGFASTKTTYGVYNAAGTRLHTPTTGWSVLVLNRTTAAVVSHNTYNTYSSSANATAMAAALDALGTDRVVVCYTYDEPRTNVYNNATLITAMERCGATAAAIGNIKNRGAYILVGIPGRGAGTGYEKYAGAFSSDPAAWVSYTLQLVKGEPVGLGTTGTVALEIRADTQASSITGLQGQYTVKIDTAGHVSGFGLASTLNGATPTSAFGVRANQFFLAPPAVSQTTAPTTDLYKGYVWVDTSSTPVTKYWDGAAWTTVPTALPFVVQTTPTIINGVAVPAGVYMDTAYIKNGTISTAQIGNAAIDSAKIADAAIVEAKIGALAVTNAKIGGFIQSDNYSAGVSGWKIAKDGGAEFGFANIRGTLAASQISAGSITADKIDTKGLSIKDTAGNTILSAGSSLANSTLNIPGTVSNVPAGWLNSNVSLSTLGYTGATNATRNAVSYGSTTPSAPVAGDIWIRTDLNPVKVGVYNGSAWVDAGNVTTNTNQLTDGANLGSTAIWASVSGANRPADNSTRNVVNYGSTAPSGPVAGDIWIRNDLNPVKVSLYNGTAWVDAGNVTTNTNQLTDGANLGQTAAWGSVSSRPANLSALAGSENIQNSQIIISGGQIQGIGTGNNTAVANSSIAISATGGTISMTGGPTGSVTGVIMPGYQITAANVGTYLASAAIGEAYIGNLSAGKITTGTLSAALIAANSIDATKIDSRGLSIKDASGNVILAAGTALNWSNVTGQPSGIYNSNITLSESSGTVSLNNAGSGSFVTVTANNKITSSNISTYISDLAVNTVQIAGEAVIIPRSETGACGGGNIVFMTVTGCVANRPIILMAGFTYGTGYSDTNIYTCRLHRWNADITYETYYGHAAAFPRYAYPPDTSPTFIDAFVSGAAIVARYIPPSDGTYYFYINSDWPCTGTIVAIHCKR